MDKHSPCPRCEERFSNASAYMAYVEDYLRSLPEEIKTPPEEYRRRINICKHCAELVNRVCAVCGCYPETRAAKKVMYCPLSADKWR